METFYTSGKKQYHIPSQLAPDLLVEVERFFIEHYSQEQKKVGFILLESGDVLTALPGIGGKPAKADLQLDSLQDAIIDIYVSKYFFDGKKFYDEIDLQAPPFAYMNVRGDTTTITTNEAMGWTLNTFRLEDLFHKYLPFKEN